MRIISFAAVAVVLAAGSISAQSPREVTGPRTLRPAHLDCTDLPVAVQPNPTLVVKAGHNTDGHHLMVTGDVVVVARVADDGLTVGQRYVARRLQAPARFPQPVEGLRAVHNAGWVTITAMDDLNALAIVDHACDGVEPGDYLEPYVEAVLPDAALSVGEPQFDDRASVLFGQDRREIFADGDLFSIDRGTAHGVAAGARFAIYRDHRNGSPLVHVGEAVVMHPSELTSKAVLVRASGVVGIGDVAVPRR